MILSNIWDCALMIQECFLQKLPSILEQKMTKMATRLESPLYFGKIAIENTQKIKKSSVKRSLECSQECSRTKERKQSSK